MYQVKFKGNQNLKSLAFFFHTLDIDLYYMKQRGIHTSSLSVLKIESNEFRE
jgi:hypothetical protein